MLDKNYFKDGTNEIFIGLHSDADPLNFSSTNFRLDVIPWSDLVEGNGSWLSPTGTLLNQITIGGDPSAPLGDPSGERSDGLAQGAFTRGRIDRL